MDFTHRHIKHLAKLQLHRRTVPLEVSLSFEFRYTRASSGMSTLIVVSAHNSIQCGLCRSDSDV